MTRNGNRNNKIKTVHFNNPQRDSNMDLDDDASTTEESESEENATEDTMQISDVSNSETPQQIIGMRVSLLSKVPDVANRNSPPVIVVSTHEISHIDDDANSSDADIQISPPLSIQEVDVHTSDEITSNFSGLHSTEQNVTPGTLNEIPAHTLDLENEDQSSKHTSSKTQSTTARAARNPGTLMNPWEQAVSILRSLTNNISRPFVGCKESSSSLQGCSYHLTTSNKTEKFRNAFGSQSPGLFSGPNTAELRRRAHGLHRKVSVNNMLVSKSSEDSDLDPRRVALQEKGLVHRNTLLQFSLFLWKECEMPLLQIDYEKIRDFVICFEVFREEYDSFQCKISVLKRDWNSTRRASEDTLQNLLAIHAANEKFIARIQYAFFMIRMHLNRNGIVRQMSNRIVQLSGIVESVEQSACRESDSKDD